MYDYRKNFRNPTHGNLQYNIIEVESINSMYCNILCTAIIVAPTYCGDKTSYCLNNILIYRKKMHVSINIKHNERILKKQTIISSRSTEI